MNQRAFTLVELSIVLVILGLLVGGVLTGQSLIRAAELRSVSTQYSRYITAVQTFRDKYMALPGDMTNAASYWGAADGAGNGNSAACATTASTDSKTCNGNGDGQIYRVTSSNEFFRFWQHLANAGLIEGSYSGIAQGTTDVSATTANTPSGRITSTLWSAASVGQLTGNTRLFNGQYDNNFELGGVTLNADPVAPFLKPEEAYNIDTKLDDGRPATGKVVQMAPMSASLTSCTDAPSSATLTANYQLANTANACALDFRQAF